MSKALTIVSAALIATSAVLWAVGLWAPADALMPLAVIIATNSAIALANTLDNRRKN